MRARFLASVQDRGPEPTRRRCTNCAIVKPVEDFTAYKKRLKSGLVSVRPRSRCKPCEAQRIKEWKQKKIKENGWSEYRKRYEAKRDIPKLRALQRECKTAKRREEGIKPRNWHKPPPSRPRSTKEVPVEPVARFLEETFPDIEPTELATKTGISNTRFQRMKKRKSPNIELDTVDQILLALGCPEQMNILYPLEEEKLVGYQILDPDGILDES